MLRAALLLAGLLFAPEGSTQSISARILVLSVQTAGVQHHDAKRVWDQLRVGDDIQLVREPDNLHDPNAIRLDWNTNILGYLPRTHNRFVARQLDRGARLQARIAMLGRFRNHRMRLEIEVYAPLTPTVSGMREPDALSAMMPYTRRAALGYGAPIARVLTR